MKGLLGLIRRECQRQGEGYLGERVAVFYGSLQGDRRRRLIEQLRSGRLRVILATSALEAGIDLPELDCCLVRGYPGSLMSFRQRIGRAGRGRPGLVAFLPVAQNVLDYYYGHHSDQLLHGQVESAAFNPNYPTILGQHLLCGAVESGIPAAQVEERFGPRAGAIADSLLQQKQLQFSQSGQLFGRGYPHRQVNLRGSLPDSIELIERQTGQTFERMSRQIDYREVFPGAIYTAQDSSGELSIYRCEALDTERRQAVLRLLPEDPGQFTQADTEMAVEPLEVLAEPVILDTALSQGQIRLSLAWGEIASSVVGFKLMVREYAATCMNPKCASFRSALNGKLCSNCKKVLRMAEITKVREEVSFEQPYQTRYRAPVVCLELNSSLREALQAEVDRAKTELKATHGDEIPEPVRALWSSGCDFLGLHSMGHQAIAALPQVVLCSSQDANYVVEREGGRTLGYFFDTCAGGNGATEAIFQQLPKLAARAKSLAETCDCDFGCPRCLMQHSCPQLNEGLNKRIGLFLLDSIVRANSTEVR